MNKFEYQYYSFLLAMLQSHLIDYQGQKKPSKVTQ